MELSHSKEIVIFNGSTGGLGRYMSGALRRAGLKSIILSSRLGDTTQLRNELSSIERIEGPVPITFCLLAAMVSVPACQNDPLEAKKTNVIDTCVTATEFLQWAAARKRRARIIYASTGHVYAPKIGGRLIEEDTVDPRSVYARTKLEAEQGLGALVNGTSACLLIARIFGLLSPRQPRHYVLPALIDRIQRNDFSPIPGLTYVRDYLDARDVCRYIVRLSQTFWQEPLSSNRYVVNICSGEPRSIKDLLREVVRCNGRAWDEMETRFTESPGRPDDIPWIVGDPTRLRRMTRSMAPHVPLASTVREAIKHLRESKSR